MADGMRRSQKRAMREKLSAMRFALQWPENDNADHRCQLKLGKGMSKL